MVKGSPSVTGLLLQSHGPGNPSQVSGKTAQSDLRNLNVKQHLPISLWRCGRAVCVHTSNDDSLSLVAIVVLALCLTHLHVAYLVCGLLWTLCRLGYSGVLACLLTPTCISNAHVWELQMAFLMSIR